MAAAASFNVSPTIGASGLGNFITVKHKGSTSIGSNYEDRGLGPGVELIYG